MENVKINFKEVTSQIGNQVSNLVNVLKNSSDDYELSVYENIKNIVFFIENERDFAKRTDIMPNAVYVVVKFGNASTNFGASACPVSLIIMSTKNIIEATQDFFGLFVSRYSLHPLEGNGSISQTWMTPSVTNPFNDVDSGFRALFTISGVLVIGSSTLKVGSLLYKYGDSASDIEEIDFMSFFEGYQSSTSPQPFGDKNGFAVSVANFATDSFTISTYLINNHLIRDCLKVRGLREIKTTGEPPSSYRESSPGSNPNKTFRFQLTFVGIDGTEFSNFPIGEESEGEGKNRDTVMGKEQFTEYKLVSYNINQKVGDIPSITISFSY